MLGGGLEAGGLTIVGGAPGRGKTVAALQWARQIALDGDHSIYVCFEHPERTMLVRLLAVEVGEVVDEDGIDDPVRIDVVRNHLRAFVAGERDLADIAAGDPVLDEAVHRTGSYAHRLHVISQTSRSIDVGGIARFLAERGHERTALFVDYLQKVPVGRVVSGDDQVRRAAEQLKNLAIDESITVLAISAADQGGLTSRRLGMHNLRGSAAAAHEADVVILLNDKLGAVSRSHVAFDSTRHDEFRRFTVFSIDKNRSGEAEVDLEFEKDFKLYRFRANGRFVSERLWSEGGLED
jgi:replicative DNA helicase